MRIRNLILLSFLPFALQGCGLANTEKFEAQRQNCIAQNPNSMVKRVECLNKTEEGLGDQDIRLKRQQVALALAKKVDAGELTQKEADRRFSLFIIDLAKSEGRMRNLPNQMSEGFIFPPNKFYASDEMQELILSRRR